MPDMKILLMKSIERFHDVSEVSGLSLEGQGKDRKYIVRMTDDLASGKVRITHVSESGS